MDNIKKIEADLWEASDKLRSNSTITSDQYYLPVLGLIFLKYAEIKYNQVTEILKKEKPLDTKWGFSEYTDNDYKAKFAINLPKEAKYSYLATLSKEQYIIIDNTGKQINVVNNAMNLIEQKNQSLNGILPKDYDKFSNDILHELIAIFNKEYLNNINDEIIGRIYEYFINKFANQKAQEDGMFFTPKPLVNLITYIIEPNHGIVYDPACGSGGMISSAALYNNSINNMSFYGNELKETTANLCKMNLAIHNIDANIISGADANSYYKDTHKLCEKIETSNSDGSKSNYYKGVVDFIMANPPFNDKAKKGAIDAGRLPFGDPVVNKDGDIGNANYLWLQYFYSYLNDTGRAGFVIASSASDAGNKESSKDYCIRRNLIKTNHVDVIVSVANNFFYTKSLPCHLWFYNKRKPQDKFDKTLFIDARNYYTVVDRNLNEWTMWQQKNLAAIVSLYRGEIDKYINLLNLYQTEFKDKVSEIKKLFEHFINFEGLFDNTKSIIDNLLTETCAVDQMANNIIAQIQQLDTAINNDKKQFIEWHKSISDIKDKKQKKEKKEEIASKYNISFDKIKKNIEEFFSSEKDFSQLCSELKHACEQSIWLTSQFGVDNPQYTDIKGLCYCASTQEISEHNYSLTPGAYVGVEDTKDENEIPFNQRMRQIQAELADLSKEAVNLQNIIDNNFNEICKEG